MGRAFTYRRVPGDGAFPTNPAWIHVEAADLRWRTLPRRGRRRLFPLDAIRSRGFPQPVSATATNADQFCRANRAASVGDVWPARTLWYQARARGFDAGAGRCGAVVVSFRFGHSPHAMHHRSVK